MKTESERTVISIEEITRYGEEDKFKEIIIPHDASFKSKIERISRGRIENPNDDPHKSDIENVGMNIPDVGIIYFIYQFDNEYSSATYRTGAHKVLGPYIIE